MSQIDNPFARGYQNPRIVRTLLITYENDCPPIWRPLHASQIHLSDDQVALFPCLIGKDFALITEGQEISHELEIQCETVGIVRIVVYAIEADDFDGRPVHVGDAYSEEAARQVVRRLRFETGYYSRCWEISSAHLDAEAHRFLAELADIATPTLFLFIAFRIPYSPAIGLKLIATPWTDENLRAVEGITAKRLMQEHRKKGMPESLVHVLHLAALADVRMLVFDADAQVLDGLPIYDD
ncbi:MAG: ABC transporter substrate-binding protein [Proteobacteria bacterium]|nr:ABC transporter substrate-binding protein [Pseudomonadota bacterium]